MMSVPLGQRVVMILATGLGVGYLPGPKGTYGSLVGVAYYFLLWQTGWLAVYFGLMFLGVLVGVWLAGHAEQILGRKDAQEIVIDEVACFPVAMLGSVIVFQRFTPDWSWGDNPLFYWGNLVVVFGIYRALDILKPSLLRVTEAMEGGWGIMADDFLAGVCAAVISAVLLLSWFWCKSLLA